MELYCQTDHRLKAKKKKRFQNNKILKLRSLVFSCLYALAFLHPVKAQIVDCKTTVLDLSVVKD